MSSSILIVMSILIGWTLASLSMCLGSKYLKRLEPIEEEEEDASYHPMGPIYQQRKKLLVVCSKCQRAEQVDEYTKDNVGDWGDKILCSDCKVERLT